MKTVTYRGPEVADGTTRFAIQGEDGLQYFPVGVPLEVSDELARECAEQEGQNFDIDAVKGRAGSKTDDSADTASTKGD